MLHGGGGHDSGGGGGKTLPARLAQRLFEAYVQQSDAAEVERETIVATRPGRRRNELHPLPIAAAHLDAARAAVEAHAADVASMRPVTSLRSSSTELIWAKRAQVLEETNARLVSEMRRCRAAEADAAQQLVHAEEMQKQLLLRADEVVAQLQRQNRQNMERAHAETEAALRRAVVSAATSSNAVLQQRRLPDALEASSSAQTARQQNAVDVDEFTRLAEEKVEMQRQHEIDLAYVGEQFESALEEALAERAVDDAASRRAELAQLEAEARAMTARLVATEKTAKESEEVNAVEVARLKMELASAATAAQEVAAARADEADALAGAERRRLAATEADVAARRRALVADHERVLSDHVTRLDRAPAEAEAALRAALATAHTASDAALQSQAAAAARAAAELRHTMETRLREAVAAAEVTRLAALAEAQHSEAAALEALAADAAQRREALVDEHTLVVQRILADHATQLDRAPIETEAVLRAALASAQSLHDDAIAAARASEEAALHAQARIAVTELTTVATELRQSNAVAEAQRVAAVAALDSAEASHRDELDEAIAALRVAAEEQRVALTERIEASAAAELRIAAAAAQQTLAAVEASHAESTAEAMFIASQEHDAERSELDERHGAEAQKLRTALERAPDEMEAVLRAALERARVVHRDELVAAAEEARETLQGALQSQARAFASRLRAAEEEHATSRREWEAKLSRAHEADVATLRATHGAALAACTEREASLRRALDHAPAKTEEALRSALATSALHHTTREAERIERHEEALSHTTMEGLALRDELALALSSAATAASTHRRESRVRDAEATRFAGIEKMLRARLAQRDEAHAETLEELERHRHVAAEVEAAAEAAKALPQRRARTPLEAEEEDGLDAALREVGAAPLPAILQQSPLAALPLPATVARDATRIEEALLALDEAIAQRNVGRNGAAAAAERVTVAGGAGEAAELDAGGSAAEAATAATRSGGLRRIVDFFRPPPDGLVWWSVAESAACGLDGERERRAGSTSPNPHGG